MIRLSGSVRDLWLHAALGAAAGFSLWVCARVLSDLLGMTVLFTFVSVGTLIFFVTVLLLLGPLSVPRAMAASVVLALVGSALFLWPSLRFSGIEAYLDHAHPVIALFLGCAIALPFIVALAEGRDGWRRYDILFDQAWSLPVRAFTASLFTALFFAVLYLGDLLLSLVGLTIISDLLDVHWVRYVVIGTVQGLALGVLYEQRQVVSVLRRLVLRLFLLLMPPVAAVTAVFILLLPVRGLDSVFGTLSAAATLMAIAAVACKLITITVDGRAEEATRSFVLIWSARILAFLLPVVTSLAVYAILIRVGDYGWTPKRIMAMTGALILLGYAFLYLVAQFRGGRRHAVIRGGNTVIALATIGIAVLWMTPVLNVERISTNSQVGRFLSGQSTASQLPLEDFASDWGLAGAEALARLEALEDHPEYDALRDRLAGSDGTRAEPEWIRVTPAEELEKTLPVFPKGASLPEGLLTSPEFSLNDVRDACRTRLESGHPGCLILISQDQPEDRMQAFLIAGSYPDGSVKLMVVIQEADGGYLWIHRPPFGAAHPDTLARMIDAVREGRYTLPQIPITVLEIEGVTVFPWGR